MGALRTTEQETTLGQVACRVPSGLPNPKARNCGNYPGQDQKLKNNKGFPGEVQGQEGGQVAGPIAPTAMTEQGPGRAAITYRLLAGQI